MSFDPERRSRRLRHPRAVDGKSIEEMLAGDVGRLESARDLTSSIMGRLGYTSVSRRAARRHRLLRWFNRAGTTMLLGMVLLIGFRFHAASRDVRRPMDITVPDALGHDLQRGSQRINSAIQTIRNLAPRPSPAPVPVAEPQPLQDDVNSHSALPTRWV